MKITKVMLLTASLTLFSGAYLASANAAEMSAEKAIAAAKDARTHASSVNGEWRDIGKMIGKAEALLKKGMLDEAVKMAEVAEAQAMLGYMQATAQDSGKLHI